MIHVVVTPENDVWMRERDTLLASFDGEKIVLDDNIHTIADLKAQSYPTLFEKPRTVIAAHLFESVDAIPLDLVQTLAASPTLFILWERTLTAPEKKILEKGGANIILPKSESVRAPQKNLFMDVAALCTITNKKDRWLAYQAIISDERPEAIIGIMYWKLRDLIQKKGAAYRQFYDALITAHAQAWIDGTPLEYAIEKVLLTN